MKFFIACTCSALLGGIIAVALCEARPGPTSALAEQGPRLAPSSPTEPARKAAPRDNAARPPRAEGPSTSLAPDELSQDEQINIDVYESVNRSVVNINTRGVRAEGFF